MRGLAERRRPDPAGCGGNTGRALALLLAAWGAGCVSGPVQSVRSTLEKTETGSASTQSWTNLAEVSVHDHVGPDLEYRLSERFVAASLDQSVSGVETHDETTSSRPSVDLALDAGTLRWSQRYEAQEDRMLFGAGPDNELVRTDLLEKLEWTPLGLPQVTAWVDYRTVEDDLSIEQDTLESTLQVQQALEPFDYLYSFQDEALDDVAADVESDRTEHILRGTYRDEFLDGRLTTTLGGFVNERDTTIEVPFGGSPALQIFTVQGLSAIDSTPQISTLPSNPALIDGDDTSPAGINIGGFASGGELHWNMGVRLPPGSSADLLHLSTVSAVAPNFEDQFSFSVWASDDNAFWTLVSSSAAYVYEPVFRRFRFAIPPVTQTYVKIVNTASPPAAPAVLVSELRVFDSTGIAGGTRRTSEDSTRNATGNVSFRVTDELTVGYDVFAQQATTDIVGTQIRDETRIDHGLSAAWTPTSKVEASLRASEQTIEDPIVQDEEFSTLNGLVSYRPLPTLDLDLSYTGTERSVNGSDIFRTRTGQAQASAQLLDTLRGEVTLEQSLQDDLLNQREIEFLTAGASLAAELTRSLDLTLGLRNADATVTGPGAGLIPNPSEERYELVVLYRPSEQVTTEVQLEWVDTAFGEGLDQRLRLDWVPFPDGALDMQFDYDRIDTQSVGSTEFDRYGAFLRYTFNPRAFLELNYAAQVADAGDRTDVVMLAFNFTP